MADRHTTKWIVVNPPYHFDEKGALVVLPFRATRCQARCDTKHFSPHFFADTKFFVYLCTQKLHQEWLKAHQPAFRGFRSSKNLL
jgi:hypothetical protein